MRTVALQIGRVTNHMLHSEMEHLNWQTSSSFELGVEYIHVTNVHIHYPKKDF